MAFKKFRNMKVYEQSGYNYKSTPTIMLKGQWLKEAGFNVGDSITVTCENGKLITIVAEADGEGATKWGKLKSGAGWISLDYAKRI